jgi:hypothetical protein
LLINDATIIQLASGFTSNHATTLYPQVPFSFYFTLTLLTARVC